ncbi:hypothetical protein BBJ28_00012005, partial [Nothophytophthora sp. Chile5]
MIDLMHALRHESQTSELSGLMLGDDDLLPADAEVGDLGLGQLEEDAGAMVMAMMMPSTLSEAEEAEEPDQDAESELDSLWSACLANDGDAENKQGGDSNSGDDMAMTLLDDDLVSGELSESGPDEVMMMMMEHDEPEASMHADALFPSTAIAPLPALGCRGELAAVSGKKRRGRKPSVKPKESKPKRPPPSAAKARLRSYERRSRHKREVKAYSAVSFSHTMMTMKETVAALEVRIQSLCEGMKLENPTQQRISQLAMEATHLTHHNHSLRKSLDDHHFFHSMLQLEYDH